MARADVLVPAGAAWSFRHDLIRQAVLDTLPEPSRQALERQAADVLLATKFGGEPVSLDHGGPARIIIPKLYAWKGAKFVKSITFLAEDRLGFWEVRGYHNIGDPWKEERYA
jgi:DMSO/TMAO reductase YedYZ molybdopterin-dependent catalytic subunit